MRTTGNSSFNWFRGTLTGQPSVSIPNLFTMAAACVVREREKPDALLWYFDIRYPRVQSLPQSQEKSQTHKGSTRHDPVNLGDDDQHTKVDVVMDMKLLGKLVTECVALWTKQLSTVSVFRRNYNPDDRSLWTILLNTLAELYHQPICLSARGVAIIRILFYRAIYGGLASLKLFANLGFENSGNQPPSSTPKRVTPSQTRVSHEGTLSGDSLVDSSHLDNATFKVPDPPLKKKKAVSEQSDNHLGAPYAVLSTVVDEPDLSRTIEDRAGEKGQVDTLGDE